MGEYNNYAVICLRNGKGKTVLCAFDAKNKIAYQLDSEGNQTTYQYYNFILNHYADSEEIKNYLDKNKI